MNSEINEFKIEKKFPVPHRRMAKYRYPWRDMKIGDSFFVSRDAIRSDSTIRTAAAYFARRNPGYEFTVRCVDDGIRVWRVEPKGNDE